MFTTRFVVGMVVGMMTVGAGDVSGQNFPNRPIRIITATIGGGSDFAARLIAQGITVPLGQPVIIENRPAGLVGEIASKAAPDGYTLLLGGSSTWIVPLLQKTSFDPVRDFSPITVAERSPNILVVHPSVPANSVKELIALAKARPGELNYPTASTGSSTHLAAELFKAMAGVNIVRIPYKGTGPALNDLIGGQVQVFFSSAPPVMPHVKSGRLRALAVTSAEPSVLAPGLPTVAASGLPGYESVPITGIFVPAKTPLAAINRLNQEIVRFLKTPEVKEKFLSVGSDAVGSSPEELAATVKSDMTRLGKLIKDAGIRAE